MANQTIAEALENAFKTEEANGENIQDDSAKDKGGENQEKGKETADTENKDVEEEPKKDSSDDSENKEVEEDEEEDPDAEDRETGLQLVKLLKDPKTREETVRYIAKEAGLDFEKATPKQQQSFSKKLSEVLQESLKEEYALLPSGLADTLEEIIQQAVESRVKPLETELLTAREQAQKAALNNDLDWAYNSLDGFKDLQNEVFEQMQKFPSLGNMKPREYLKNMLTLAKAAKGLPITAPAKENKSRSDERLRLNGGQVHKNSQSSGTAPKQDPLDKALSEAWEKSGS